MGCYRSSQPSLIDLENLLADQEAMAKQTSRASLKSDEEALFSNNRRGHPDKMITKEMMTKKVITEVPN